MEISQQELLKQGIFVDNLTPRDMLIRLGKILWPVETGIALRRFGSDLDGGYLLPDDLEGIRSCFSPGVEENASFELDLFDRLGIGSHLADYSVDGPPMGFKPLSFTKKYLGASDGKKFMTLDTWVHSHEAQEAGGDLLLQMDIEGGEYRTLLSASSEVLDRFRIILLEVHYVHSWGQKSFFEIAQALFQKLLKNFMVVHNHPNNCCGLIDLGGFVAPRVFELTLLRKDRATPTGFRSDFPHPLDRPNLSDRADLVLPPQLYQQS